MSSRPKAIVVGVAAAFAVACGDNKPETAAVPAGGQKAPAQLATSPVENPHYSPYAGQDMPMQPYWGDTHLHTSYSTDAGMIGNVLGPDEAYRFARGEVVTASTGEPARLIRPLDFLVVADHSENLGLAPMIAEHNEAIVNHPWGRQAYQLVHAGKLMEAYAFWGGAMAINEDPIKDDAIIQTAWQRIVKSAETFNEPGVFTALHGFEWTSSYQANNLHRVVIFRDDADKVNDLIPLSNYDSSDPEDLWRWLAGYEESTGGQVLAIPHNGNLSNGLMFDDVTFGGDAYTRDYAERRARWEPLYEVTQIKGDGEAHPSLSPNDEFADYYNWDKGNFGLYGKQPDMLPREYARTALQRGLKYEDQLGANPFKFGMIGATDSHTSLATSREDNNFGKASIAEPGTEGRYMEKITGVIPSQDGSNMDIRHYESVASGLAAVWATENTRAALWDAMARKEVYATTGTRMSVRLFAGWDFAEGDVHTPDFARLGYEKGVPMGGDLSTAPAGSTPGIMIQAAKDPDGANLDRVQVVKGWMDAAGELHEKIYDVACSDGRAISARRCVGEVGSTVDVEQATYLNTIGEAQLNVYWQDPDFDPNARAFYYVRVLEIPTPSWLAYDRKHYAVELPEDAVMVQQDRAYTSPVWYTP